MKNYPSVGILIEFLIWGFGEDVETDIDKIKTLLALEDFKIMSEKLEGYKNLTEIWIG